MSLVNQVFDESTLNSLVGHVAVGHTRYSTTGGSRWENAQPTLGATATGAVALAPTATSPTPPRCTTLRRVRQQVGTQVGELRYGNASDTAPWSPPCSEPIPTRRLSRPLSTC